jgi:hypothetical protein
VLRFPRYWMSGSAHRAFIYFEICMLRTRHDNISRITVGRAADGNEPPLPILTARTATYAICFDIYVVFRYRKPHEAKRWLGPTDFRF